MFLWTWQELDSDRSKLNTNGDNIQDQLAGETDTSFWNSRGTWPANSRRLLGPVPGTFHMKDDTPN
jgi:hypothetical protein